MGGNRSDQKNREQKKRGNAIQSLLLINMFLILGIALGILLFLKWKNSQAEPQYQYISLSEEAAARAYIWLDRIEDMPLDYAQIRELFGDIRLTVVLTPGKERGRYIRTLAEGSYAECLKQAESGLERAYREVLRYRLEGSTDETEGEIAGGFTDEMLDELMKEAYGVSVSGYLEICDIQLIPTLEELAERYSGEVEYE